jgi:RNA polymerase sigma-70 factor (ECF subfamily)
MLYERYSPKMLGVCRRYIKDNAEAEQVMVGGFVKIFQKINQFKGEGSFEGWVRRIMVNEALIYIRKNKNMYLEMDISMADDEPDYKKLDEQLEADDLLKMVRKLPQGYRMVFNLYAIEGYSHKEIAIQLSINVNTSKSQLSRARKLLQQMLKEREEWENNKMVSYERQYVR